MFVVTDHPGKISVVVESAKSSQKISPVLMSKHCHTVFTSPLNAFATDWYPLPAYIMSGVFPFVFPNISESVILWP